MTRTRLMSAKYISRISLRSISLCSILLLLLASPVFAGTGTFGSYIGVDDGGGNTFYGASQPGSNFLTAFDGHGLGTYTVGDSLLLSGAELLTWKSDGGDVTSAFVSYNVHLNSASAGTFNTVNVSWTSNSPLNDAAGNTFSGSGDQKWANINLTPDLMSGLGAGSYEVEVYFMATTNEGDRYSNNGGSNYVATFDVNAAPSGVPEPAALLMAFAGLLSLVAFSRRRR